VRGATLLLLMTLAACTTGGSLFGGGTPPAPEAEAAPPPPPLPPPPPPIDVAGRWRLTQAGAGGCAVTFGNAPGAAQGTIEPAGGCPGNFFTSRKWTFEHDVLVIRDHKDKALAHLTFAGGHFEGQADGGAKLTLSR
jgi:hypothetical protein